MPGLPDLPYKSGKSDNPYISDKPHKGDIMLDWHNFDIVREFPWDGYLYVYVTAEVVTSESGADADRRGYVSDVGATDITEHRNDVEPVLKIRVRGMTFPREPIGEDDQDSLTALVESLGAWHSDDGSTLYGQDSVTHDYSTDEVWNYAVHASRKFYRDGVVVEDDATIVA